MIKLIILSVLLLSPIGWASDCVILLHGLARTDKSMTKLENALLKEKYVVVNSDYNSRKGSVEALATSAIDAAVKKCGDDVEKVHFVTHSMGGILLRQYLSDKKLPNLGRTVMLGPPNQGSEVIDKLGDYPGFSFLNGEAGLQLGTGQASIINKLGPVEFDLGIIAGNKSVNLLLSQIIPGTDDGKVSVESTKVEGMKEHLLMPVTHTFMMTNKKVIRQVIHYLEFGSFKQD